MGSRTSAGVRDEHGVLGLLDRVERRLIIRVRDVDRDSQFVHASHGAPAEVREPILRRLLQAGAERVALAVADAEAPHPEAVEDVDATVSYTHLRAHETDSY